MPPVDDMLLILAYVFKILQWGLLAALVLWAIPSIIFSLNADRVAKKTPEYAGRHRRVATDLYNEILMNTLVTRYAARS